MMLCVSRAKLQLLRRPLLLSRPLNRNQLQSLLLNQSRLRPQLLRLNRSQLLLRPQLLLLLLRRILVCWCVRRRLLTARWCWSGTMLLV